MEEQTGIIKSEGKTLTLVGKKVKIGDKAPDFVAIDNDMLPVEFSSFRGKVCIIAAVTSIDTSVCDLEGRRFNEEAGKLSSDIVIITISMDLPFAQKRWCGAEGVDKLVVLSDHRDASFGISYGVLIKELRLLARSVFVVDRDGIVRHIEIAEHIPDEPDYEAALAAANSALANASNSE